MPVIASSVSPPLRTVENEVLIVRGLTKWFQDANGLGNTIAHRLLNITSSKGKLLVFQNVNLTVYGGECLAILGGNGSGKSTFLRCLAGVVDASQGEILRVGNLVSLLSHGFGAYEELPIWRNILLTQQLLGASLSEAKRNLPQVAEVAGVKDRLLGPTSHLSEGMRAKIYLASLTHSKFTVALLDESLNHVDAEFKETFFLLTRKWLQEGKSLLMTSHDDQVLSSFATKKLRIENTSLVEMGV